MNKEMIVEMVRSEIKRQANADVSEAISNEEFDVFGYDGVVKEEEQLTSAKPPALK